MRIIDLLKALRRFMIWGLRCFPSKGVFGAFGKNSIMNYPVMIDSIRSVFVESNVTVRDNLRIINTPNEKVVVRRYSVISSGVTIITNSHRSTVGIPHFLLGPSHFNDKIGDVKIEEDVWVGANATILAGVKLGRGCVVAAGAVVTKSVPPYTLVAGVPAIIKKRVFTIEQILQHEAELYPPEKRLKSEELELLSAIHYEDDAVYGADALTDDNDLLVLNSIKKELHYVDWKG